MRLPKEKAAPASDESADNASEFAVLLACARTGFDTAQGECIRALVSQPLNWDWLTIEAVKQGVFPLLYHALNSIAPDAITLAGRSVWQRIYHVNVAQNICLVHTLAELIGLLEESGVRTIPYKGPVLASTVYGNLALRRAGDLDLLVHRRDFLRSKKLLLSQGYQLQMAYSWETHFARAVDGLNVDLHKAISPTWHNFRINFDDLWQRCNNAVIFNMTFPNLSCEDLLIVLCIGIVKDTAAATVLNLFKICDIVELVKPYNGIKWELLLKRAKQLRAQRALFIGLRAADDLLGISMPEDIRDLVFSKSVVETIARHTVAMVRYGRPTAKRFPYQTRIIVSAREHPIDKALVVSLKIGESLSREPTRNICSVSGVLKGFSLS
jgi:Uncharacterised nucleotidyltransferase